MSFNGKVRFKKSLPAALSPAEVEAAVLADRPSANIPKAGLRRK